MSKTALLFAGQGAQAVGMGKDLAGQFHSYYNAERMLVEDAALKDARVALAAAVRQVIRNGLAILGVSCPQSM